MTEYRINLLQKEYERKRNNVTFAGILLMMVILFLGIAF